MKKSLRYIILLAFFIMLQAGFVHAQNANEALLIVSDHSSKKMTADEQSLKKYLAGYRSKYGFSSKSLPILVYNYSDAKVKKYCRNVLKINKSDLLFLGIVSTKGNLPVKILVKISKPKNLEKDAKTLVENIVGVGSGGSIIRVSSSPSGAKVWFDGVYKGKTPLAVRGVTEGGHTMTLVKQGYTKVKKEVSAKPGKSLKLSITIPREKIGVLFTSKPKGAKVYIDGKYYGVTPLRVSVLKPGSHKIVMKQGQNKWYKTIKYVKGKAMEVGADFSKKAAQKKQTDTDSLVSSALYDTSEMKSAFVPKAEQNSVFRITVNNIEEVTSIKDYYKPKPGYKFVIVYVSQQNISDEIQIYTGQFSLLNQDNSSFDYLENLSNFWLVVLKPGGMNLGYLVYEIPQDSKPMAVVLHGLNMAPLSVPLK